MIKVILLVLLLLGAIILLFTLVFSHTQKKLAYYIAENFNAKSVMGVSTKVNFYGLLSEGYMQFKGKGAIVLEKERLTLIRAYPLREYTIDTNSITQVVRSKSFLSKRHLSTLLIVRFTHEYEVDAIGFSINNIDEWENSLQILQPKV